MNKNYEMRFTGSGGQGVILISIIMAEAAVLAGKHTTQSQAYGPEARGGSSKAETIICDDRIWFTKVQHPNFLLALTQKALDQYTRDLPADTIVMIDSTLSVPANVVENKNKVYSLPILATATEKVGKSMVANIVAVGAINGALGLFDDQVMLDAVKLHIPAGTEELNLKAFNEGKNLVAGA